MNIETYKKIIDEADNSIMTGSAVTSEYVRLLSTLRLAVDEAGANHRKMADRVNDMQRQIQAWRQENETLHQALIEDRDNIVNIKREHRAEINRVRRQAGIWKAKTKRLEGVIAAE